jgi:tetratricopeptide (TPR) repeat protein
MFNITGFSCKNGLILRARARSLRFAAILIWALLLSASATGQTSRPGLDPSTPDAKPSQTSRPGVSNDNGANTSRPGTGTSRPGLGQVSRPGITDVSRPGLSAISRPGLERDQRLGIRQVGEASTEASHQVAPRRVVSPSEALVEEAERLTEKGQYEHAVEDYRKAIQMEPTMISARLGIGYTYIKMGDFDAAAGEYREAIEHSPNNQEAQLNLGVALYRGGHIEEAINQYQQTLQSHEDKSAAAHFNLAVAYAHQGDFQQAITHYQSAIAQHGRTYAEAHNNLGLVYEAMDHFTDAAAQYRLAIEQQNHYALAHYNLGRFYQVQGNHQDAINEYIIAIKQQSDFPEAYLDLGNLYLFNSSVHGTNELDKAINLYKQAIQDRDNNYPLAHENLAIALTKKGDKKGAVSEYKIAFDQYDGECPETLINLMATISEGDFFIINNELSRPDNAGNLKTKKNGNQSGQQLLKRLADNLGKYEEMDDPVKDQADVRYCAGRAYMAVGNLSSAADELARALELAGKKYPEAQQALVSILTTGAVRLLP